jgi:ADP-ribosylglycohydrolase
VIKQQIKKQQIKRGQQYTLVVKKEKRKKKFKQTITDDNPIMICLHALLHVKESMTVHLVMRWMSRFGH